MSKAVRIDGHRVLRPKRGDPEAHHADLFLAYVAEQGLTDDEADAMIEAGRVEWGQLVFDGVSVVFKAHGKNGWRYRQYTDIRGLKEF